MINFLRKLLKKARSPGGPSEPNVVGGEFFLTSFLSSRTVVSADPPVSKSSNAVGDRGVSFPGVKTTSTSSWSIIPAEISIFKITRLIPAGVEVLCLYTWQHFVPHLHGHFLVGELGTRARRLFRESWLWQNNKLQFARWTCWELFVSSWTSSSTVRKIETGPKSRNYSKPSLETEKIMSLYCGFELEKTRKAIGFWLTASTKGNQHDYALREMIFVSFAQVRVWLMVTSR